MADNVRDNQEHRNEAQSRANYIHTSEDAGHDVSNQREVKDACEAHGIRGEVINTDDDTKEIIAESLSEESAEETGGWMSRWFG
jgi:hypothetical protein